MESTLKTIFLYVPHENLNRFINWQEKINHVISAYQGFVSLEISCHSADDKWTIVERFDSLESAEKWNKSEERKELITELKKISHSNSIQEELHESPHIKNGITEVIVSEVPLENQKEFKQWAAKVHKAEAKFPGFRGMYQQCPTSKDGRQWITFLTFDTPEHLDNWLKSEERQKLLEESKHILASLESHRVVSPYAGWFVSTLNTGKLPPLWKQAMIILLMLFPIVMLEYRYFNPLVASMNLSLGTFLGNAISVSLLTWPFLPIAIKALQWWLKPTEAFFTKTNLVGIAIVLTLYLLEIYFFWNG